jgi:hypothetical protein
MGVPRPAFLDGPPKTSDGKKSFPQGRMFKLPYLLAAGVSWITRDSIRLFSFEIWPKINDRQILDLVKGDFSIFDTRCPPSQE